ncbi:DRTGG domain-containing protein [Blautia schinkii]|nr:DRTGG domain-containing protein [Blautia schinkii]
MTINAIKELLDAQVLFGEELLDLEAEFVFSSDMMSDVLAYAQDQSVLVTGLCNPQVVRTAEMLDIVCIVFVRGKSPDEHILRLAREKGIVILATEHHMFTTCGILYVNGLRGGA